jgi:hypothetical protein
MTARPTTTAISAILGAYHVPVLPEGFAVPGLASR